jgi:hypothetical protein
MLYFAAILTIITWYQYGRAALPVILDTSAENAKDPS